ncbi:hypothetical protein FACS1894159_01870 [Bacteroidia bacterium]|nr:hypothetical protein FACS1894159_01870 [Bacteroidia bacterium]
MKERLNVMKKIILAIFVILASAASAQHKTQREVKRGKRTFIIEDKASFDKSQSRFRGVYDKAQWDRFKNEYESKGGESGSGNMVRIATPDSELKAILRRVFTDAEIKKYNKSSITCLVGLDPQGSIIAFRVSCKKIDAPDIPDDKLIELQQVLFSSMKFVTLTTKIPFYSLGFSLNLDRLLTDTPMFPLKSYKKP